MDTLCRAVIARGHSAFRATTESPAMAQEGDEEEDRMRGNYREDEPSEVEVSMTFGGEYKFDNSTCVQDDEPIPWSPTPSINGDVPPGLDDDATGLDAAQNQSQDSPVQSIPSTPVKAPSKRKSAAPHPIGSKPKHARVSNGAAAILSIKSSLDNLANSVMNTAGDANSFPPTPHRRSSAIRCAMSDPDLGLTEEGIAQLCGLFQKDISAADTFVTIHEQKRPTVLKAWLRRALGDFTGIDYFME
jgi:hypothetical protein